MNSTKYRLSYLAFVPLMLTFLLYVGVGYYKSIITANQGLDSRVVAAVCVLIAVLVFLIVRTAAFEFNRANLEGGGSRYLGPALMFCALLTVSAYGFLSTSVVLFEGPQIARESLTRALSAVQTLASRAPALLADADYDALAGRVKSNLDQLTSEIQNVASGSFCGVGDKAKATLGRIRADLPQVDVINGTDRNHDCRDRAYLASLQLAYGTLIRGALANSPQAQRARIAERRALLDHVAEVVRGDVARLRAVDATLAGLPSFVLNKGAFDEAVSALNQAIVDYDDLISRLSAFVSIGDTGLAPSIDDVSLAKMSSGLQLIGTIGSRLDRPSVLFLVFCSIASDVLATLVTFRAIRYQAQLNIERKSAGEALKLSRAGVDYIWRPRLHPLRRE